MGYIQELSFKVRKLAWEHLSRAGNPQTDEHYLGAAVRVAKSANLNCNDLKIPIFMGFNLVNLAKQLQKYNDTRLLKFLTYRFLLGMQAGSLNKNEVDNHHSALAFPRHVKKSLDKEKQLGVILGHFSEWPARGCHASPLTSRPTDGDERRIMLDLSNGGATSVHGNTQKGVYECFPCFR